MAEAKPKSSFEKYIELRASGEFAGHWVIFAQGELVGSVPHNAWFKHRKIQRLGEKARLTDECPFIAYIPTPEDEEAVHISRMTVS
ncbi:MAG: hypothetical protein Q8P82_02370 [bacterium]|nr:hypothetical protein [bacterium]